MFLEGRIARLAYFDEDSAEIYEVDLEHANTFKQYTYRDGKVTEISINSKCLSITSSNNITNDFKALLNSLSVKFNINYNKQVEYCSFEFELPKLIEEEKIIKEPIPYIPKCKAVIIDKNIGRVLSSTKDKYSMNYQETRFKLTPNIFRNDILPRFAVTNRENIVDTNNSRPKNIDDIVIFVSPLRQYKVKSLTEKILLNPNKENFNSFLLRYYDEIIQALQYFQNEDINKFYVFENELNRLQLK